MAKRELSSTLKNLKFMQRAIPKKETPETDEINSKQNDGFSSLFSARRKCVVIMEGNPQPAGRGRMSFGNFNPAVDKMYEESSCAPDQSPPSDQRENDQPISSEDSIKDLKRKQAIVDSPDSLGQKAPKSQNGDVSMQAFLTKRGKSAHKQQKREKKLDWNVLRPPNLQRKHSEN